MIRRLAFAALSAIAFHIVTGHLIAGARHLIASHAPVHHERHVRSMNYDRSSDRGEVSE